MQFVWAALGVAALFGLGVGGGLALHDGPLIDGDNVQDYPLSPEAVAMLSIGLMGAVYLLQKKTA